MGQMLARYGRVISYVLLAVVPSIAAGLYLHLVAADQYHSRVAFSVRSLETSPAASVLGMLTQAGGGGAEEAIVVYDFLRSQRVVERIDQRLNLEEIYNAHGADALFGLGSERSIEDKTAYWNFTNQIAFDNASRVIEVETRAFSPEHARMLAQAVAEESEALVNTLSERARADAVRFAEQSVEKAEERLRERRVEMSQFRRTTQEIDPTASTQLQYQLVATLEGQLAAAETQLKGLLTDLDETSPSVRILRQRIVSLNEQIARERAQLAGDAETAGGDGVPLSQRLALFEELTVELEFASALYTAALSALSQAEADARRSQRYLAVHISPTLSEESLYPSRALITLSMFVALSLLWAIGRLILASIMART